MAATSRGRTSLSAVVLVLPRCSLHPAATARLVRTHLDRLPVVHRPGPAGVFLTKLSSELAIGVAFAIAAFVVIFVNVWLARRMAPRAVPINISPDVPEQFAILLERLRGGAGPILDKIIIWGALILAFLNASGWPSSGRRFASRSPRRPSATPIRSTART